MASMGDLKWLVLSGLLIFVLKICFMIFKKFRFQFEPVSVFLLNYFGTLALYLFSSDITFLLSEFPASEEKCFQYIFFLFASMAFSLSVLCMQADRFLAIFWSIHYKNRVTTDRAGKACCLSLLLSLIVACGKCDWQELYRLCFPNQPTVHKENQHITRRHPKIAICGGHCCGVSLRSGSWQKISKSCPKPSEYAFKQPLGYQEGPKNE